MAAIANIHNRSDTRRELENLTENNICSFPLKSIVLVLHKKILIKKFTKHCAVLRFFEYLCR